MEQSLILDGHPMPGVWRFYLPDPELLRLPRERQATCDRCRRAALGRCRSDCCCCTHLPRLPNTMIGLALEDSRAAAAVETLLGRGQLLPFGLVPTPSQHLAAAHDAAEGVFGQDPTRLCPFARVVDEPVPGVRCQLHPFRGSICASYFCAFDHGPAGEAFWGELQALVGQVESALAWWAMGRLGLDPARYRQALDSLADQVPAMAASDHEGWPAEARRLLWGDWLGRERLFFAGCARLLREHRDELFTLACDHPHAEAVAFERALYHATPEEHRQGEPPTESDVFLPVEAQWYRLQLAARNLWALPFGEGPVGIGASVTVAPNPQDDAASRLEADRPFVVESPAEPGERIFLTAAEAALLGLFTEPRELGEAVMDSPEADAVDDAREFLARMMRMGVLKQTTIS